MESRGFRQKLKLFLGSTDTSYSFSQKGEEANIGLQQFRPREGLPQPEISGVDVRHVELV
jgi:hypothetical protein